jgi:hypothetical protein
VAVANFGISFDLDDSIDMYVQGAVHEEIDGVAVKLVPFLVGLIFVFCCFGLVCPNIASSHI